MGNFLSHGSGRKKKEASKISSQDRSILDLKIQRDKLRQYQKRIEVVLQTEREMARRLLAEGQKEKAVLILQKKKYQEKLLEQTDTQLLNLETLTRSIEYALVEQRVLAGLQEGNKILTKINKEMSIEQVEKLMAETVDAIAYQNEISALMSGQFSLQEQDELEAELQQLCQEQLDKSIASLTVPQALPLTEATTVEAPVIRQEEEEEEEEETGQQQQKKPVRESIVMETV